MRKFITLSIVIALCFTLMTGCGAKDSNDSAGWSTVSEEEMEAKASVDFFAGEWDCRDATLEEHGLDDAIYVGGLYLTVDKDGSFKIIDTEQNDMQLMAGKLEVSSKEDVHITCDGDFYPPECWDGIEKEQDMTYLFDFAGGKDILRLTYTKADGVTSTLLLDRIKG